MFTLHELCWQAKEELQNLWARLGKEIPETKRPKKPQPRGDIPMQRKSGGCFDLWRPRADKKCQRPLLHSTNTTCSKF
ncbi:hypothetical protein JZ751_021589 [Albula glossodonta]|uniref:Uncharacterized protein n=1 Tax=Albula glossodonta TaxID=121402 RepID=A0A8T2NLC9_9TELE|nr:hypothetical protein JZ751_021589 [Albula glossodonta]